MYSDDFPELQGGTRELRKVFFDKIPVKQLDDTAQKPFISIVDKILEIKSDKKESHVNVLEDFCK